MDTTPRSATEEPHPATEQKQASSWKNLVADAVLWLLLIGLLAAFRGFLIWHFNVKISPQTATDRFFRCFTTGFHFDACVATYAILPSLLLTLIGFVHPLGCWHGRVRRWLTAIIVTLCAAAFLTDIAYIEEYNDQFNHWIFGLIYDDKQAIFQTIWKSYPIVIPAILGVAAVAGVTWAVNKLWRKASSAIRIPHALDGIWVRVAVLPVVLALAVFGLRGSFGRRPIQQKDAAVTGDVFLNKIVVNPFFALRSAIHEHYALQSTKGIETFLRERDLRSAAAALFPRVSNPANLDACLERTAPGAPGSRPDHIFIVVMESYDSWARQAPYSSLHLMDRIETLGQEGIQAWAFVSAGDGTIKSLGAIISGLPFSGVFVNYQPVVHAGVPTAAPGIFKRLGYRTRFFYSGYLSWQRVGDFSREQGFDEVYGGDSMGEKLTGEEWGVDDETLFRFVLDHTGSEPTFNVLMSTSYHPPFNVDVESMGFDLASLRTNALCRGLTEKQLRILGHLWYSDQSMANFVKQAEQKLDRPLFALTGDHYSREESVNSRPTLFESVAVPLVLCGHKALEGVPRPGPLAGSHVDILPTLVNLVAPSGFTYHAFGRDMLDASQPQIGYGGDGCDVVLGTNFVLDAFQPARVEDLKGNPLQDMPAEELVLRYRQFHGLAWWRAMKGSAWPEK